jgi:parallel beta-helix repeat protein
VLTTVALTATPLPASADTTVATDGFDRSVGSGWGSAPSGGSWSLTGGSSSSVGGSASSVNGIAAGRSFYALLPSVQAADVTVRASFAVPSGTEVYYGTEVRRQANGSSYRGRARIDKSRRLHAEVVRFAGGQATVLAQTALGTVAVGDAVTVELGVSGSSSVSVRSKVYRTGTTVPDWQARATDTSGSRVSGSGTVGVNAYVGPGNASQSIKTQSFSAVTTATAATPPPVVPAVPTPTPSTRGSAAVGTTSYPVPSNAVFVSTSGNDGAAGTQAAPVRTVTKALTKVSSGQTIVIRGGTYHEYFIVPPGKAVTIQSYPKEAVWFDGSSNVSGFTASGSVWKVDNWTAQFDATPGYTKGMPDGTTVGRIWINPEYPMAAHPDAVWINGTEQTQVRTLSQVKPGTFFVDYGARRLYVGSNPAGQSVQASTLAQAVSLRAPGTTLRGLGFRRYANSVWQQGVITSYQPNMRLENIDVRDSATAGVGIYGAGCSLKNVSISGSGQMGLQASYADGLVVDGLLLRNSNDQRFNPTPSAGGFKVTTTRGLTLKNSDISGTVGNQFWTDESVYDINVLNNVITNGARWGVVLEISSTATVANNVISGNARDGLYIVNTDKVNIWNNTLTGNGYAGLAVTQDTRRIEQLSIPGHDRRRAQPDWSMPWISREVSVANNIFTGGTASKSTIYQAESWDRKFTGNELVAYSNGNVFSQAAVGTPKYAAVWGRRDAYAVNYANFADFVRATGRDTASYHHLGGSPVDSSFRPVSAISSRHATTGQPLPASVAAKIGQPAGVRHLGAFR